MGFLAITPAAPLAATIAQIWDWQVAPGPHRLERILPAPGATLIVNLHEDATRVYADAPGFPCLHMSGTVLDGPSTQSFVIDTTEQIAVMGVVFRPGGAYPYFRERIDRLCDRHTDIADLLGDGSARLRERLLEAASPQARLAIVQRWLCARAAEPRLHPAIGAAVARFDRRPDAAGPAAMAKAVGLSPRRFRELFREHVGMGPMRYVRLQRFREVIAATQRRERIDWARVAADAGFHDQAHLVHEFRRFAGMTPGAYLAAREGHVNHIPLP